jgi:uncharacterized membrane protein
MTMTRHSEALRGLREPTTRNRRQRWCYLIFVLVGGAVVVVGLAIMGALFRPHAAHPISPIDHARDILGERYLAGEINTQEYCRRRDALR